MPTRDKAKLEAKRKRFAKRHPHYKRDYSRAYRRTHKRASTRQDHWCSRCGAKCEGKRFKYCNRCAKDAREDRHTHPGSRNRMAKKAGLCFRCKIAPRVTYGSLCRKCTNAAMEKYRDKTRATGRRNAARARANLSDMIVRRLLVEQGWDKDILLAHPEIIELKRAVVIGKRITRSRHVKAN